MTSVSTPAQDAPRSRVDREGGWNAGRAIPAQDVAKGCDWPDKLFGFLDEPGEHDPCYVVMPDGAMLSLNHHAGEGVDIARAKFIVSACNAALSTPSASAGPQAEAVSKLPDEEAAGKTATRLLDQWSEIEGAENFGPYRETMAFLGKPNSAGWVWAHEVRFERDFDAERKRNNDLTMEATAYAESIAHPQPQQADTNEIVSRLYRRFKEWSKRGFGPDDVTWCEVKADIEEMIRTQPQQADARGAVIEDVRKKAAEAIRTFCKSLGAHTISISSDGLERIYYSGLSLEALAAAVAIALQQSPATDGPAK